MEETLLPLENQTEIKKNKKSITGQYLSKV